MSDPARDDTSRYLRTELLERIAHELRGPAGVTLGALDELEHALDDAQRAQHKLLFAMARRGARRVLRTAERLTRTAQLEGSGIHAVATAPTDLRGIVKQATEEAEAVEGRSSIKVALSLPEQPCMVAVDGGWLQIALGELVAQAIRCARKQVEVQLEAVAAKVRVTVTDDRIATTELTPTRFVPLKDRRDAALGWPLICDVAEAHGGELQTEVLRDAGSTAVSGLRIALVLNSVAG